MFNISRILCVMALAVLAIAHPARGQQPAEAGVDRRFDESRVTRRALQTSPRLASVMAAADLLRATESGTGLYPNPELQWEREGLASGASGAEEREDHFSLSVPLDLSGRRRAQRALARSETFLAEGRARVTRSQVTVRVLSLFYGALAAERRVGIAGAALARLQEASRVLNRRHKEGAIAGYEPARIELAVQLAASRHRQRQVEWRQDLASLAVLLEVSPQDLQLVGELRTAVPESQESGGRERPSAVRIQGALEQLSAAGEAAKTAWIPRATLAAGVSSVEEGTRRTGYLAGVSLELPITSRGQDLQARARAGADVAREQLEILRRRSAEQEARALTLSALRAELTRFEAGVTGALELVERGVLAAYREGRGSILDLLNAQASRTRIDARRLELSLSAKKAELMLRAARGEFE